MICLSVKLIVKMSTLALHVSPISQHSTDEILSWKSVSVPSSACCDSQIDANSRNSLPQPTKFVKQTPSPTKRFQNIQRQKLDPEVLIAHRAAVAEMITRDESACWTKTCVLSDAWIRELQHADAAKNSWLNDALTEFCPIDAMHDRRPTLRFVAH